MPQEKISILLRGLRGFDRKHEEEVIREHFSKYGAIRDIYLPKDYFTGEMKKFGFIEFVDSKDAEDALRDRHSLEGREIQVQMAEHGRKRPEDFTGGRGGGGGGGGPPRGGRRS
eukprot:CAMPEP_0170150958 /NCGR_PEP_ID=MMETSP0033_2-20121228/48122_1 /TAXON_ID=195969 /ORGANISM="Dolichomastix tenuilepis, Strain CCMP3274" /LENGTH=113 /DNA_ID=CAMNT_0010388027 /DNA_START=387 /DNA_END=724 /DNA_ORIENTATION=-